MHAALAVTSYGVFAALAVSSALHLHHYRNLKSRRPAATSGSLPSVRELDQLNFRLLSIATGILTLSMAIGSVFWFSAPQAVGGPKLLAATALWIASLVVVGLRLGRVAQGHRLSWCGILLFAAALASLWPVKHQRPADQVPHTVQRNG
jgi:ABC-type uncharacterized transport system permease subunit